GYLVPRQLKQHGLMPSDEPAKTEKTQDGEAMVPAPNSESAKPNGDAAKTAAAAETRLIINDDVLRELVRRYTREAGVRNLEREIGTICRKVARTIAEGKAEKVVVGVDTLHEYLGPERFDFGLAEEED